MGGGWIVDCRKGGTEVEVVSSFRYLTLTWSNNTSSLVKDTVASSCPQTSEFRLSSRITVWQKMALQRVVTAVQRSVGGRCRGRASCNMKDHLATPHPSPDTRLSRLQTEVDIRLLICAVLMLNIYSTFTIIHCNIGLITLLMSAKPGPDNNI